MQKKKIGLEEGNKIGSENEAKKVGLREGRKREVGGKRKGGRGKGEAVFSP